MLVTRPDRAALREVDRSAGELEALGLKNQHLVVNAVFEATDRTDPVAIALERRGREALREMPARLQGLPTMQIPLRPFNMVGLPALRALLDDGAAASLTRATAPPVVPSLPPLASLIDDIVAPGRGLVMVMGKGGVGKTTIAAAIAAELASRGHSVHLSTTDPAAHIATTLAGQLENLTTSRIDPIAETKAYVDRVMATRGANLDEAGRALLAEDLRSPCYEEVAVFGAFSRIVGQARSSFVVLDTAPDRAHAAPARRHGLVSPADACHRNRREAPGRSPEPRRHSVDAAARSGVHEGLAGDARGDHARFRGGAAPGGSAARAD